MRIALGIEYDGHEYHGWQAQQNLITVQGCLEEALEKIAAEPVKVFCAGRTDAGVHATGQVVHFDTNAVREMRAWTLGVNTHLPRTISVRWVETVDDTFHARFSALTRRYRYIIYNQSVRSAILAARVTWFYYALDAEKMRAGAQYLLGEHDFTSFRAAQCEAKTPVRTIEAISVTRHGSLVVIDIEANAFLHHMVRNIAGALMRVGTLQEKPEWIIDVLKARDRTVASETAAATGLYLTQVRYPEPYQFPQIDAPFFIT